MIVTELYNGQGLGNQLWTYVVTRVIARDRGYGFGIKSPEKFKGRDFMNLDFGKPVVGGSGPEGGPPRALPQGITHYYAERSFIEPKTGSDIRTHDSRLTSIADNTQIDGLMQDENYILHRKDEIRQWLAVNKKDDCYDYSADNICVINFRGGSYVRDADFFLPQSYWDNAIAHMKKINPAFKFIVITEDVSTAQKFFPHFPVHHFSIAKDYSVVKNAHYLILSNSSFAWFPAWLSITLKYCIAPKYWARHNISDGFWSLGYNITRGWTYMDRNGKLFDYDTCKKELESYNTKHADYFKLPRIKKNFMVVSHFKNDSAWIPEVSDNYLIYDQSGPSTIPGNIDPAKVKKSPHTGHNLTDYLSFIIERYDSLPECTIFTKGNVFPRYVSRAYFERIMNNDYFTPIEEWDLHDERYPQGMITSDGGFSEINNNLYLRSPKYPLKYFNRYDDFLRFCFKNPVTPRYARFAPGAMYIVPKAHILKYPKVFYENLLIFVSHSFFPGEAYILERALHTIWAGHFELTPAASRPIDPQKTYLHYESTSTSFLKKYIPVKLRTMIPTSIKKKIVSLISR